MKGLSSVFNCDIDTAIFSPNGIRFMYSRLRASPFTFSILAFDSIDKSKILYKIRRIYCLLSGIYSSHENIKANNNKSMLL